MIWLTCGMAFMVGFFFGVGLSATCLFLFGRQNTDLKSPNLGSIIEGGSLRMKKPVKRAPRANTDLIAYQREIEEQGENRV